MAHGRRGSQGKRPGRVKWREPAGRGGDAPQTRADLAHAAGCGAQVARDLGPAVRAGAGDVAPVVDPSGDASDVRALAEARPGATRTRVGYRHYPIVKDAPGQRQRTCHPRLTPPPRPPPRSPLGTSLRPGVREARGRAHRPRASAPAVDSGPPSPPRWQANPERRPPGGRAPEVARQRSAPAPYGGPRSLPIVQRPPVAPPLGRRCGRIGRLRTDAGRRRAWETGGRVRRARARAAARTP